MTRPAATSILWIDIGGAAVATAMVVVVIGYVTGPRREARAALDDLGRDMRTARADLAETHANLDERRRALEDLQRRLKTDGVIPDRTPVEANLTTLVSLAQRHDLAIESVTPLAGCEYPGLLELRYACQAHGTTRNIMAFLRAVETDPFWTDVSYLSIQRQSPGPDRTGEGDQSISFVVSLFSSGAAACAESGEDAGTSPTISPERP